MSERPAIVMTEREHLVRAIKDGLRRIEEHDRKIGEHETKRDEREVEVGTALKALKAGKPTSIKWGQYLEECNIGIHRSRADQLIRIADGRTTLEEERADTAERVAKSRDELPIRIGEDDPEASAEAMKAKFAAVDDGLDIPEYLRRTPKGNGGAAEPITNPLVEAWAKAGPKVRSEFVRARWAEIMEARTGIGPADLHGNGGMKQDEDRWIEGDR
jgi:hypothetical protein